MEEEVKIGLRDRILMNVPLKQKMLLGFYIAFIGLSVQLFFVWQFSQQVEQNLLSNQMENSVALITTANELGIESSSELNKLIESISKGGVVTTLTEGDNSRNEVNSRYVSAENITVIVKGAQTTPEPALHSVLIKKASIYTFFFVILIFFITSSVSANLLPLIGYIIEVMQVVASGNLKRKVGFSGDDEFGQLGGAIDGTIGNLESLIAVISSSSSTLNATTKSIYQLSQATCANLSSQNQQIDSVATAIDEMNSSIREVANNTELAEEITSNSHEEAQKARANVDQTIITIESLSDDVNNASEAVQNLESNATKIGSVVETINSISEQTNLLALNAAIEAARAGEQGRGFAVVADEVRSLAQRTQTATVEIQQMIEDLQTGSSTVASTMKRSTEKAGEGVERVNAAVVDIENLLNNVQKISDMNVQISAAVHQQSKVTKEINENIHSIRDISESTLHEMNTIAEGNEEMSKSTDHLTQELSKFTP